MLYMYKVQLYIMVIRLKKILGYKYHLWLLLEHSVLELVEHMYIHLIHILQLDEVLLQLQLRML